MELNQIYQRDCREYMQSLPDACVSLIIADPPYGISKQKAFSDRSHGVITGMSESWDIFGSVIVSIVILQENGLARQKEY